MQDFSGNLIETLSRLAFPKIGIIDIIQIALIAFFVYQFMVWIKYTHAYTLLKGILVVLLFILIAYIFRMNTILWIFSNLASTLIVGVIVIFQPELRKVLEQLFTDFLMILPVSSQNPRCQYLSFSLQVLQPHLSSLLSHHHEK